MTFEAEALRPALYRYCAALLRDLTEAEDVVNEVLAGAARLEAEPVAPRAWLYTAARNRCLNRLRSLARRPDASRLSTDHDVAASLAGPLTQLIQGEARAELQASLRALPEGEREALHLRYAEGLTRGEVARVLGLPESTIKSRLAGALARLRESGGGSR